MDPLAKFSLHHSYSLQLQLLPFSTPEFFCFVLPKPTESRHNLTRSLLRRTLHMQESMHISVINVASDHYQLTDCANDPESLKTLNSTILPSFRSTLIMCAKYVSKSFCVILAFPL